MAVKKKAGLPNTLGVTDGVGGAGLDLLSSLAKEHGLQIVSTGEAINTGPTAANEEIAALLVKNAPVSRDFLSAYPNLRLIYKLGILTENIDLIAARESSIEVRTVLLPSAIAVAEHTLCLMLATARHLIKAHQAVLNRLWPHHMEPQKTSEFSYAYNWAGIPPAVTLFNKTLGLVGLGEIGLQVASRASAFGMKVLYYKRNRLSKEREEEFHLSYYPLETLLSEADIVSLHLPHTEASSHLLDRNRIALMKPSAILVNTARGGIVDNTALADALATGKLAGAGLDVFEYEPLPPDSPLLKLDNVVLTPHIAGAGPDAFRETLQYIVKAVARTILSPSTAKEEPRV